MTVGPVPHVAKPRRTPSRLVQKRIFWPPSWDMANCYVMVSHPAMSDFISRHAQSRPSMSALPPTADTCYRGPGLLLSRLCQYTPRFIGLTRNDAPASQFHLPG